MFHKTGAACLYNIHVSEHKQINLVLLLDFVIYLKSRENAFWGLRNFEARLCLVFEYVFGSVLGSFYLGADFKAIFYNCGVWVLAFTMFRNSF